MFYKDRELIALDHDASCRRYYRDVTKGYLLMNDPQGEEKLQRYIDVGEFLAKNGVRTPKIYDKYFNDNIIKIEDFGDELFGHILKQNPEKELDLYSLAVDVLINIHNKVKIKPDFMFEQDLDGFIFRVGLFLDYFYKKITGKEISKKNRNEYNKIWQELLIKYAFNLDKSLVHYDYHCENLILINNEYNLNSCGVIDFQDARWGDVSFDIMSLLDDARSNISDETKYRMIDKYLEAFPKINKNDFMLSYKILSAKRACKVLGLFTKFSEDNEKYLKFIPKAWNTLLESVDCEEFKSLRNWLDNCFIIEYENEINNYLGNLRCKK